MGDWISIWAQVGKHVIARLTRRGDLTAADVHELYGRVVKDAAAKSDEAVQLHCATGGSTEWGAEAARALQRLSCSEPVSYAAVSEMPVYYTL